MSPPTRKLPARACKRLHEAPCQNRDVDVPVTGNVRKSGRYTKKTVNENLPVKKDGDKLLKIFPEEVWKIILDLMTAANDFQSVSNSSLYFRSLLLPKRTQYLFPNVWNVLGVQYHLKHDFDSAFNQSSLQCLPRRRSKVARQPPVWWYSGILRCRLVCKTWNQAIDNFYQSSEILQNQAVENSSDWTTAYFPCTKGKNTMINFIRHFQNSHVNTVRNPFLGRKLHISHQVDSFSESQHDWNAIGHALQAYGHHIWNCTLEVSDAHPTARIDCYLKIRELLKFTPNLKVLNIQYTRTYGQQQQDPDCEVIEDTPEHLANLLAEINLNSKMPTLAHLDVLVTKNLLSPIFHEILRANSHVSSLQVVGQSPIECDGQYEIANVQLPNMRTLSIKIHSPEQRSAIMMPENHWSLQKLKLDFGSGFFVDWPLVFAWIHDKGATTLTDLELNSPKSESIIEKRRIMKWSFKGKLNLSRMKQLKLSMSNLSTLDFLLPLKDTLEHLDIQVKFNMSLEMAKKSNGLNNLKSQKVEFVGFHTREKMLKSNIWQEFPKLKTFRFLELYPVVGDGCSSASSSSFNNWFITRDELDL